MAELIIEKIKPEEVNLNSFESKNRLNPKIWSSNKLKADVKKQLLKIADDFFDSLDISWVEVKDIRLTGSLANYNWSEYSDLDVHLIIDYKDVEDNIELVTEYLKMKRDMWNDNHKLRIFDYDVEMYAQNENESHAATGLYSIVDDKWIKKPSKTPPKMDKDKIRKKAASFINKIDDVQSLYDERKYEEVLTQQKKLWGDMKKMRKAGLTREGEFSFENIIFKVLRRGNYIEQLQGLKIKAYDQLNSLETNQK
jgi:translation elongation factor P/translation initiation factor 5A